jgi:hypothetical protein
VLEICCFKWKPAPRYRSKFGPETVNILRNMLERNYSKPHRLTCITDDPAGIDPRVRIIPLWTDHANLRNPNGSHNPSCYRRLKLFSAEAAEIIGPRFAVMDLDTVIVGDMAPIFDRPEDFVIWGGVGPSHSPKTWYNGSLWMLTAGSRTKVWEQFDPKTSPRTSRAAGCFGSDQGWIAHCLGPNEAMFSQDDGVYSYRIHLAGKPLPQNARLVNFHGKIDPWHPIARRQDWIREHYR